MKHVLAVVFYAIAIAMLITMVLSAIKP